MAEAEPDARVVIEDGDTIRTITARELIEEIDSDAKFGKEVAACLGGLSHETGARRSCTARGPSLPSRPSGRLKPVDRSQNPLA